MNGRLAVALAVAVGGGCAVPGSRSPARSPALEQALRHRDPEIEQLLRELQTRPEDREYTAALLRDRVVEGKDLAPFLPELRKAMEDENLEVRRFLAWALARYHLNIGETDTVRSLLRHPDGSIRWGATLALKNAFLEEGLDISKFYPNMLSVLLTAFSDSDDLARSSAANTLQDLAARGIVFPTALPALEDRLAAEAKTFDPQAEEHPNGTDLTYLAQVLTWSYAAQGQWERVLALVERYGLPHKEGYIEYVRMGVRMVLENAAYEGIEIPENVHRAAGIERLPESRKAEEAREMEARRRQIERNAALRERSRLGTKPSNTIRLDGEGSIIPLTIVVVVDRFGKEARLTIEVPDSQLGDVVKTEGQIRRRILEWCQDMECYQVVNDHYGDVMQRRIRGELEALKH